MKKLFLIPVLLWSAGFFVSAQEQNIKAKDLEKQFAKVNDTLYASKFETTNSEYRMFLQHLQATGKQDLYQQYEVDSAKWENADYYAAPLIKHYHRHPAYSKYPVVNISYEAAQAYCQWLTDQYHTNPKRKFRKVQFVLPTETEWMLAAQGGRSQAMFPWGNYYLRNSRGEYLCNFKRIPDAFIRSDSVAGGPIVDVKAMREAFGSDVNDRAIYTATVKSFWPNDFGIYNFSGNVSEMVAEKTFTKGGSWNSYGYYVQIRSREEYKGPSPQVGFRVFMKVIEP
jgi:formylglycine-generating enzyme